MYVYELHMPLNLELYKTLKLYIERKSLWFIHNFV